MENEETIKLLNIDLQDELKATLIYTYNSFVIDDCDISRVTEAIAIDEMRHIWWLADLITKRGARPLMEVGEIVYDGRDVKSELERQLKMETEAIDEYERQIGIIDDDEVVGVLKHIIDEEKRHRKEFKERLEKL